MPTNFRNYPTDRKAVSTLKGPQKEMAKLAVSNGVVIFCEPSEGADTAFQPAMTDDAISKGKKLTLKQLQNAVGGYIELVNIPSANPEKAPTVLVVNEEGQVPGMELPYNQAASSLFGRQLHGNVVWLPRDWIN